MATPAAKHHWGPMAAQFEEDEGKEEEDPSGRIPALGALFEE